MSTSQLICAMIGALPSFMLFFQFAFILSTDKDRKHKSYHITGEWALRFLYFCLSITPIKNINNMHWIIPLRQTFGLLSFYYASLHLLTYLRYTLIKDGYTISAFLYQLNDRSYLIWGVLAWILMVPLAITSRIHWKTRKGLGFKRWKQLHRTIYIVMATAAYHVINRNWDRTSRGKSAVESAAWAPYIVGMLLGYRVVQWIYGQYASSKDSE